MTAATKFLFERDFSVPQAREEADAEEAAAEEEEAEPEIVVPTFGEEDLVAARQEGFAEGKAEGVREAAEATEREILTALEEARQQFGEMFRLQKEANTEIAREALAVAAAIARKVFPDLNARNALGEIERMVTDILDAILEEPKVHIFVAPALRDPLADRLETIAERVGYEGRLAVAADKMLNPGDCRIEWANGGAVREMDMLWQQIDEIVERNLEGGHRDAPAAEADAEAAAAADTEAEATPADEPEMPAAADDTAPAEATAAPAAEAAAPAETAAPAPGSAAETTAVPPGAADDVVADSPDSGLSGTDAEADAGPAPTPSEAPTAPEDEEADEARFAPSVVNDTPPAEAEADAETRAESDLEGPPPTPSIGDDDEVGGTPADAAAADAEDDRAPVPSADLTTEDGATILDEGAGAEAAEAAAPEADAPADAGDGDDTDET